MDDIGLLQAGADEAEALYRLVDAALRATHSDRVLEPGRLSDRPSMASG